MKKSKFYPQKSIFFDEKVQIFHETTKKIRLSSQIDRKIEDGINIIFDSQHIDFSLEFFHIHFSQFSTQYHTLHYGGYSNFNIIPIVYLCLMKSLQERIQIFHSFSKKKILFHKNRTRKKSFFSALDENSNFTIIFYPKIKRLKTQFPLNFHLICHFSFSLVIIFCFINTALYKIIIFSSLAFPFGAVQMGKGRKTLFTTNFQRFITLNECCN